MNLLSRVTSRSIGFYQKNISRFFLPSCRFHPSCSEYSKDAFYRFGFFKGCYLTVKRLLRCNPFCGDGHSYDPLPSRTIG